MADDTVLVANASQVFAAITATAMSPKPLTHIFCNGRSCLGDDETRIVKQLQQRLHADFISTGLLR